MKRCRPGRTGRRLRYWRGYKAGERQMNKKIRIFKKGKTSLPRFAIFRPREEICKMRWTFHQTDDDMNPSVPHGHSDNNLYRLSIWDGKVYRKQSGKLVHVGQAKKKEMIALYRTGQFQVFVNKARDWYKENHTFCPPLTSLTGMSSFYEHYGLTEFRDYKQSVPDMLTISLSINIKNIDKTSYPRY